MERVEGLEEEREGSRTHTSGGGQSRCTDLERQRSRVLGRAGAGEVPVPTAALTGVPGREFPALSGDMLGTCSAG